MIPRYELLPPSDVQRIHATALDVLARDGCRVLDSHLLGLLRDGGCAVDKGSQVARFPGDLVRRALALAPSSFVLYDRLGEPSLALGPGNGYVASGHGGLYVLDGRGSCRRPATKADVAAFSRLSDALDEVDFVSPVVFPQDVPAQSASLHALEAVFANTRKHVFFCVDSDAALGPCLDLARIATGADDLGHQPRVSFQVSPSSPLTWTPQACQMLSAAAAAGVPTCILASAMCGTSAPYTLAGALALHHAETLTGVVLAQLVRPGLPCIYSTAVSSFDMRRGHALLASPESALLTLGSLQLARHVGVPTHSCFPCSEAHAHDEQQAWEKVWTALPTMLAGGDMLVNLGLFAGGLTASLAQLVLDAEMVAGMRRLLAGFRVTEETLARDAIEAVGPGGNFMGQPHTVRHLRTGEHWMADLSSRQAYDVWERSGSQDIVEAATRRVRHVLKGHAVPALERSALREMDRTIAAFEGVRR